MDQREFELMAEQVRGRITAMLDRMSPGLAAEIGEDVAQDTFLKMWTIRDRLDSYASPPALALTIARHRAIDLLREKGLTVPLGDEHNPGDPLPSPHEEMEADERTARLMAVIGSLPSAQQMVVRMRHLDGMEIDRIARLTGSSPGAIRTTLSRARQAIRQKFLNND